MNPNTRRSLFAITALVTLILGVAIGFWRYQPSPVTAPADWVFELDFPNTAGERVRLDSTRGRLTVVNFWATWCPPCIEEMPDLSRIHADLSPSNIKVIGLAIDSPSNVREFMSSRVFSYPLLITGAAGSEIARKLGNSIDALPYTVLIDEKGRVINQKTGRIHEDELRSWIKQAS
jgi:thiol-disulfide isomerase/thioredoxin